MLLLPLVAVSPTDRLVRQLQSMLLLPLVAVSPTDRRCYLPWLVRQLRRMLLFPLVAAKGQVVLLGREGKPSQWSVREAADV